MPIEIFLLSIGASFVQRTTGFGFGIFIMTMLPAIMSSYGQATTLSGILAMTTSFIIVLQKHKYIVWSRLLPILITFVVVSAGAIFMLKRMEYSILNILLGITLIVVSIYFSFFSKRIKIKPTKPLQTVRLEVCHHKALCRAEACIRHTLQHHLLPLDPRIIYRCRHQQRKAELSPDLYSPAHLPAEVGCQKFCNL